MNLKHINTEISLLATMKAKNYISNHGLEKLKEFKYLKSLHEEKVKNLSLFSVSQQRELLNALADEFNDSTHTYVRQPLIEKILKAFNCG
jgi:hypothetical protein